MFKKLTFIGALLSLLVIILGAYVRLSNAGLGCPDWPGCYGQPLVSESTAFKDAAVQSFPDQPLDTSKAWKEMTHRYLAGSLVVVALVLVPLAWRLSVQRKALLSWVTLLIAVIGLQAALGMWTVQFKVMPIVVTTHMLLGFITFWLLSWIVLKSQVAVTLRAVKTLPTWFIVFSALILLTQIILGGWVSSNYAALACTDLPRCQGQWWPEADYQTALNLFHGLITGDAAILSAPAQLAVHSLHRVLALVSFLVLTALMLLATGELQPKSVRRSGLLLSLLLLVQIGLGVININHDLPLWSALAHNAVATLLVVSLLRLYFYSKYAPIDEETLEVDQSLTLESDNDLENFQSIVESIKQVDDTVSLFARLRTQLKKTRGSLGQVLNALSFGQHASTRELLQELEASLLMADLGMETTNALIQQLTERLTPEQLKDAATVTAALKQNLYEILAPCSQPLRIPKQDTPYVILVVGVNGVGKTTSIGKLAHRIQSQGYSVMLAAGDTFRAAAVEQLQAWGERNNVAVVAQHSGADSASVIFDGLQSAQAKGVDVLIADTAGRLHTKSNLMDELKKIKRIMAKLDQSAPHEVLLILDAGTGQNALAQAKQFNESVGLTGLALTKLDGTAKGGIIFALAKQLALPIRFIGVGEAIDDLQDFDAGNFVDALFTQD